MKMLTVKDVAELLRISAPEVCALVAKKQLVARKLIVHGRKVRPRLRFLPADVEEYQQAMETTTPAQRRANALSRIDRRTGRGQAPARRKVIEFL